MATDLLELVATLGIDTSPFEEGLSGLLNGGASKLTGLLDKGITIAVHYAADFMGDVFETGMGFDKQMAAVQAVLGKEEGTVENMTRLRAFALDQAKDSIFTAEETAEAYYYMGMAGWKSEQMIAGLPGILDLAAASGEDLGRVSDIVTDSITAFGLTADDVQGYVDLLAQTVTNSNTNVAQLGNAFKYAAPLAGALGVAVDDVALSLGLMASQDIKGSQAGTSMRAIFQRLSTDTNGARSALEDMGVEIFDSSGKMRDWGDIINDSREAFSGLTEQEKIQTAYTVAGQRGMSGWLAIMNATESDVKKLSDALKDANGAAKDMADTKLDSLQGDLDRLSSSWDILKIAIYDETKGPMREIAQEAKIWIDDITEAIGQNGLQGGIDMLSAHLDELAEDEKFKTLASSVGNMLGVIVAPIIDHILPRIGEIGANLASGVLTGLSNYLNSPENGGLLSKFLGLATGAKGKAWGGIASLLGGLVGIGSPGEKQTEAYLNMVGSSPDIQNEIENLTSFFADVKTFIGEFKLFSEEAGGMIVDNVSPEVRDYVQHDFTRTWTDDWDTTELVNKMDNTIDDGGTRGAATAAVNAEDIFGAASTSIANNLESEIGGRRYSINVSANVTGLPDGTPVVHNARAMNTGRIFNRPTIFGYAERSYQVAGDAGPEAVVGVGSLQRMIAGAVMSAMSAMRPSDVRDSRPINVVFELDGAQKWVYRLNKAEEQRVGLKLSKGGDI